MMFFLLFFSPLIVGALCIVLPIIFLCFQKCEAKKREKENREKYERSTYYKTTQNSYSTVMNDLGLHGEYLIYENLQHYESFGGKFLFNLYIPKGNGDTTEIDVLLICKNGIFVFESKNFSGWIFGSENQKQWVQSLSDGHYKCHKEYFYNPVLQNQHHIQQLRKFVGWKVPVYSIVAFSERCTLMNVCIKNTNVKVVNRSDVGSAISELCTTYPLNMINEEDIDTIYNLLLPFTNAHKYIKEKHISSVRNYK